MDEDALADRLSAALRPETAAPDPARIASLRALAESEPPAHRVIALRARAAAAAPRRPIVPTVAAAVAVLFVLSLGALLVTRGPVVPREPVELVGVPASVEAEAELIAHTWGTELILEVSGLAAGEIFDVAFFGDDGVAVSAGSFIGVGPNPLLCELNAAILRPDAVAVEITDRSGSVVISASLD